MKVYLSAGVHKFVNQFVLSRFRESALIVWRKLFCLIQLQLLLCFICSRVCMWGLVNLYYPLLFYPILLLILTASFLGRTSTLHAKYRSYVLWNWLFMIWISFFARNAGKKWKNLTEKKECHVKEKMKIFKVSGLSVTFLCDKKIRKCQVAFPLATWKFNIKINRKCLIMLLLQ